MSESSNEANIPLALQALQNDPRLSFRRAASIYQVHPWTLYRRQKGILSQRDTTPKSRKLSNVEEQTIVEFILDLDSRGSLPCQHDVEEMANRLLADRGASPVGKNWASNFVKRHSDLQMRFSRKNDYVRDKCEDPAIIRDWFKLVENTIAKYGITRADIYNFDETGFMMGVVASEMVVTGTQRRGKAKIAQSRSRKWASVFQAINAEGWAIAPFIMLAGQYHLASWYRETNLPNDWVIAVTHDGWADNDTGLEWLKHFDRHTKARSTGSHRLLILDGHEFYHSIDFETYCEQNRIITLCMPPRSSYLLQPLDVGCFGPLKNAYGREIEKLIRLSITRVSKIEFLVAFHAAYQATMTESSIKGGFREAGLVPLDPESVVLKLDVQRQAPAPANTEASLPHPRASRTPNTVLGASSQSGHIERRIRRDQSSSPAFILETLKSLIKDTKTIAHDMELLRSEIRDLRQSTEALGQRRRSKRTRLRDRRTTTVDESG
ncbi:hypothetical protein HOO65_090311 [Ceratocystis lukuohia]|uniref:HTH CENPB-type domain-containing protein n=1 Tax=Ceratocystis lukuohia TaxID=2019550 RepID=A0ABR4M9S5_9PEZI